MDGRKKGWMDGRMEGRKAGKKEGRREGRQEGRKAITCHHMTLHDVLPTSYTLTWLV